MQDKDTKIRKEILKLEEEKRQIDAKIFELKKALCVSGNGDIIGYWQRH